MIKIRAVLIIRFCIYMKSTFIFTYYDNLYARKVFTDIRRMDTLKFDNHFSRK